MVKQNSLKQEKEILYANWNRYRGRHVLVLGKKIFSARTGKEAFRLFKKLEKDHPQMSPLIAYIPKEDTLILWL